MAQLLSNCIAAFITLNVLTQPPKRKTHPEKHRISHRSDRSNWWLHTSTTCCTKSKSRILTLLLTFPSKKPDHLGVSKNRGKTPKWMVKIMEISFKWMIWGENPLFSETPIFLQKNTPNLMSYEHSNQSTS